MPVVEPVEAVLFDWGGTLSTHVDVDLLDMWRAAAQVLAPDGPEPVAAALLAAELRWWRRSTEHGDRSGTTAELVRSVATTTHLDVPGALEAGRGTCTTGGWPRRACSSCSTCGCTPPRWRT